MQPASAHRPALVGISARTPIGSAHGALSGWHPINLLAHVLDALAEASESAGVGRSDIDRIVIANATPVGALCTPLRSLALANHWSGELDGIEVGGTGIAGHQALALAAELVAHQLADNVLVCAIDMASVVPPGAPLLRRDYGKPLTPIALRELAATGGHLPEGPFGDTLGFDRQQLDDRVAAAAAAATAWAATATPTTSSINDPERNTPRCGPTFSTDEPLRREASNAADLEPMFNADGAITAMSLAQPCDGALALLVSASAGTYELGSTVRCSGSPIDPLTPMVDAVTALEIEPDLIISTEPSAAHSLALADRLGIDPAAINPHGGPIARGRLHGTETLQGLHDMITGSDDCAAPALTLVSASGDGAALASRLQRH